jgi:hypothetical protein
MIKKLMDFNYNKCFYVKELIIQNSYMKIILKHIKNILKTISLEDFEQRVTVFFESNDVKEPWQGNKRGSQYFVQDGIYNYIVTYQDLIGKTTQLKGNIIIAR